ncbi:MAG: DUF5011 domain-containing protein, partial [Epsilonproteobacteria bacterium]|nr:DUF5011 domain-containing protein [Campylobacterota bacterium]
MGILSKRSIIFVILFLFFAGCGGGDGKNGINNNLSNETLIKKGKVVDGYLKGANVCIDINSNLKCDNSEPSTKTKEDGSYLLKYSSSISNELSLIAYGGVDTSTNQPFNSLLKAPLKYENITPITTLIDYQRKVEGSLKKAEESVAKLFNIPKDELLDDPILRAKVDKKLFKTSLKIQKIVDLISSLNPSNKKDLKKIDRLFERIAKISSKTQNFIDATIEAAKDDINISEDNLKDTLLTLDSIIEDSADSNESIADIEAKVHIAKSEIQKSIKEKKKIDKDEIEDKIKECRKDNLDNCIKDNSNKKEQKDNKNQDNKGNNNHKQQKGKKDNNQGKDSGDSNSSNNKDTTPPNIILNGDKEIKVILGDSYKELGARAIDNKDGEVNVTIISYVDDKNLGDYNVTYIAKDSAGNKAQKIRIVKVVSPKVLVSNLNISKEECQSWREIKVYPYKSDYFYTLNNNDWGRGYLDKNSTGVQCIFKFQKGNREFGGWYWGWPDNQDYQVKGYPEAIYGAKFRRIRNKNSGFPALVRSIDSIIVDMGYIDKGITKNYNIALEFWLHTDKNTSMNNIEYEIMFRFDPKGFHPNRIKIGEYEIDGVIYDVYTNNRYNGKIERRFINFVAHQKVKRVHVDFKKVLDYLTELEFDDIPDRYMSGIEMGVEVINGRGVFILDQLDVNLRLKDNQQNSLVNLEVGDPFEKRYKRKANYSLKNAPKGMRILNGGLLTWTPTKSQVGDFNITVMENNKVIDNLTLKVKDKDITINGYFVDPTASANGDGSEENPFNNFKDACKVAKGGDSLYIRGGVYKSADYGKFIKRPARFINISGCIGEENNPITIRPWGNELVKLQSNGLNVIKVKNGSKYVVIQNFEVEGIAKDLNQSIVASQWWDESDYVKSGGISIGADYITVKDCIVHDMPGVGISSTKSKYTTIEGNIVYNCDWWTIAGSHGVGITQAKEDEDNPSEGKFYNKITNNLMFSIEQ